MWLALIIVMILYNIATFALISLEITIGYGLLTFEIGTILSLVLASPTGYEPYIVTLVLMVNSVAAAFAVYKCE